MDKPTISRKDYKTSNNVNNLPSRKFDISPYFYLTIIISTSSLGLYYYNGDITNYLVINIMSLLNYISGLVGGSGKPDGSDDNNLTDMGTDISLLDFNILFSITKF